MMVTPVEDGRTLEVVLGERMRLSRRGARRLLDARCVFVNDRRVWMARHRLDAGDRIEVHASSAMAPAHAPAPEAVPLQVLFEDGRVLVVDKPSGLVSNGEESAESAMRARRRDPSIRAVHRLDRDTTGCLLLARSDAVFDEAVEWFRAGRVHKVYEAIAVGRVGRDLREVASPIDGQSAVTRVSVVDATDEASHLRLVIETGRTHQIRRHLEERGHPIAGDKAYGTSRRAGERMRGLPRQMLHAAELSFPGAGGADIVVRSSLPADFRDALKRLGLR
jgi:23S rRNA pseudouridine1911/1915/1917 synthase